VLEAELIAIHFPLARVAYARGKAHNCMMPPLLDFWFDFASTYSYPAAMQIAPVAQQAGVIVRFRPFLLGPLFKAQGWPTSPFNVYPAKGRYMWRDLKRICFDFDLPFRQPEPFPQNSLLAARVALIGLSDSWGEEFCRSVFRVQFGEGRQIDDPTVISDILSQLRIESAPVLEAARQKRTKPHCARKRKRRSTSASLARRVSRHRAVNCSGATIVLNARSLGQKTGIDPIGTD
jgi:2-hydroxychromene-2-carboxylate isomerase